MTHRDIASVKEALRSKFDRTLTIGHLLGEGGQGRVFAVKSDGEGQFALKWYHQPTPARQEAYQEQRKSLETLVISDPPDTRFLWPLDLVYHEGGYGYLMKLRPKGYFSIEELVLGQVAGFPRQSPYRTLCTAAMGIVDCFRRLHLRGLCYKDINYGGPFFRADTGEVLICDNDNVRPNRTKGIIFYAEFAAPEVVRGEAQCTIETDAHSLAVLLYYVFVRGNPLEGRREASTVVFEDKAKMRTFGTDPVFVFDPENASNRPVTGIHDAVIANWPRLPAFARSAFVTAFGPALRDPQKRANDTQWLSVFSKMRDSLSACSHCMLDNFLDLTSLTVSQGTKCVFCGKFNERPPRLAVKDSVVCLSEDCCIYPHHLGSQVDYAAPPIASFSRHETKSDLIGLKNLTKGTWTFKDRDDVAKEVPPGKSVSIAPGRQINFGSASGNIVW